MRRALIAFGLVLVTLLSLAQSGHPAKRVEFLKPYPRIVGSRDDVMVKVRVEPDPANRLLITAALDEGGEVVRRSDESLDGAQAPRTRFLHWRALPAGDLVLLAEVWDSQKPLGRAQIQLCVRAPMEDICPSLVVEP